MKEFIICSAIYINDGKKHSDQPKNIKIGYVISGIRHNNCYAVLLSILGNRELFDQYIDSVEHSSKDMGFITSMNKYVDRKEAFIIAKENNQLLYPKLYGTEQENILTSECLFPTDWENFTY